MSVEQTTPPVRWDTMAFYAFGGHVDGCAAGKQTEEYRAERDGAVETCYADYETPLHAVDEQR